MVDEKLAEWIDTIRGEARKNLIGLARAFRYKNEKIRKLEKFVEDVRGVMGFGYETTEDMIKDLEIYMRELEK